uniref:Uncharacterized protein n=2 Tax=Solanum tuberosum TaxID=4113 RepID=M1D9I6_SOLTU
MQYTNRQDGNTSSQYQQHQKKGINNKPADEEWQTQKRKAYRPVQHSMDRPKSPKETLQQQQTHHTRLQAHTKLQVSELQFSRWKKGKMTHIDQTTPNLQKDRNMMNQVSTHKANMEIVPKPTPYTIIQSFAARLRQNQAKNDIHIDLATPIITTKKVLPAGAITTHTNQQPNQEKANEI